MSSKISPRQIVSDHFGTLYDHRTGKWSFLDYGILWGVTVVLAGVMAWSNLRVTDFGEVIAGAAILTGFAFGLLVFVFQLRLESSRDGSAPQGGPLAGLLNELFTNVAYTVLVGLVTVISLIAVGAIGPELVPEDEANSQIGRWASAFVVLVGTHFTMSLLMCLKRTYIAYDRAVRNR